MRILVGQLGGAWLGIFAVTAAMMLPASAEARCKGSDIKGNYQVHMSIRTDRANFWATCNIRVTRNGTVKTSGSCTFDDGRTEPVGGGSLRVSRACRVSGAITVGAADNDIVNATMSRRKDFFAGVGQLGTRPTDFTAVKN